MAAFLRLSGTIKLLKVIPNYMIAVGLCNLLEEELWR